MEVSFESQNEYLVIIDHCLYKLAEDQIIYIIRIHTMRNNPIIPLSVIYRSYIYRSVICLD